MRADGERLVASKPCRSLGAQGKHHGCSFEGMRVAVRGVQCSTDFGRPYRRELYQLKIFRVPLVSTGLIPSNEFYNLHQMPSLAAGDMGEGVTAYREVTSAWEIARELADAGFLGAPETNVLQGSHLDERVLEAAGFQAFASFRTNREKFRWVHACGSAVCLRNVHTNTNRVDRGCYTLSPADASQKYWNLWTFFRSSKELGDFWAYPCSNPMP